jgi:hypothetical protein
MYGSEKAAEIVKQYELPFMDRFDAQGNEDVPEIIDYDYLDE